MGYGHRPRGALDGMREHALRAAGGGRREQQRKGTESCKGRELRDQREGCGGARRRGDPSRGGAAPGCTLRALVRKEKADKFPYS